MRPPHLKDAYYSVAVKTSHRKYLRFLRQNTLYQFTCLPNGLSSCCRKFTKLFKPPLTSLHKKGHTVSSYIDDLFPLGRTYNTCTRNVVDTYYQFDSLWFIIHLDKSIFIPYQRLVLLGFVIHYVTMTITLTPEKTLSVKTACASLIRSQFASHQKRGRPGNWQTNCILPWSHVRPSLLQITRTR